MSVQGGDGGLLGGGVGGMEERASLHQTSSQGFPQGSKRVEEMRVNFATAPSPSLLRAHPRWQLTPLSVTQLRQKTAAGVKGGKKEASWG